MPSPSPPPPPPPAAPRVRSKTKRAALTVHVSVFNSMPLPWKRDWAELPLDALSCVLHKLDTVELLLGGAARACRSWRRAARDEPELWRRIDVRGQSVPPFLWQVSLNIMVRDALRLSAGRCEAFFGEHLDDDLLLHIAEQAPSLKSLHLIRCYYISEEGFAEAIKKFHLLEELELSLCLHDTEVLELVAKVCPRLKHFRLVQRSRYFYHTKPANDRKAFAIAKMQGLRSLHLVGDELGNEGLKTILNNCPHLEYLNMYDCDNIDMDDSLEAKCARINIDDYEYFMPASPCSTCCFSPRNFSDSEDDDYYYYLGDDVDDADLEEHERILDKKSMRRYLS